MSAWPEGRDDDPNTLTPEPDKLALSYFKLELLCCHQTSFVNEIQLYMTMISLKMGISQQAMSDVYPFQHLEIIIHAPHWQYVIL